jgi:hypothetical protein
LAIAPHNIAVHKSPTPSEIQAPLLERLIAPLRRLLQKRRLQPIRDPSALRGFLQTRASYVAQMTLYGYLRTRSGVRFPELFDNDHFVASINIAKWHVWLACLSDLAAYAGGMLRRNGHASSAAVGELVQRLVEDILAETGKPADAGPEFPAHADRVRARLALCDWAAQADGDGPFVESPGALVYWAPIVDELKVLDEEIVRNSVRFRWNEIREQMRRTLDAHAVMGTAGSP